MITVDIETSPTTNEKVIQRLADSVKAPGNYKKQESIDKWLDDNRESEAKKLIDKTALDGTYGSIRCIGYAIDQEDPIVIIGMPENEILSVFFGIISGNRGQLIGHNVKDFDLKFIMQRAIINSVVPPSVFGDYMKRYSDITYDTMTEWAGYGKRISLENLAQALVGRGKTGNGADVFKMTDDECAKYCADDVILTRDVANKMMFIGGE